MFENNKEDLAELIAIMYNDAQIKKALLDPNVLSGTGSFDYEDGKSIEYAWILINEGLDITIAPYEDFYMVSCTVRTYKQEFEKLYTWESVKDLILDRYNKNRPYFTEVKAFYRDGKITIQ